MKKAISVALALGTALAVSGCNQQFIDTTYRYTYAYIELPNGECVEGPVKSWLDYENSDQIQVVIDGVTYFTDTTRVVLSTQ